MTEALLAVLKRLPPPILQAVIRGEQSYGEISEIRIRTDRRLALTMVEGGKNQLTALVTDAAMVAQSVSALCDHSMHAHMDTIREGYVAVSGGIRVGVAGRAVCEGGAIRTIADITSLCIRIPANVRQVCSRVLHELERGGYRESYLFFSPPGVGKTTLLRDLARVLSNQIGLRVALIDTRMELGCAELASSAHIDLYSGYPKGLAIEMATRTMNPQYIICDEIGSLEEAAALLAVENAGVPLLASAHARDLDGLLRRQNIRILHRAGIFDRYVGLTRDGRGMSFRFYDRKNCIST